MPVHVWGRDTDGNSFEELAHTLDLTPTGARLGGIHHHVKTGESITVDYKQRKIEFRIVWIRLLEGAKEYQLGLHAVSSTSSDVWLLERH